MGTARSQLEQVVEHLVKVCGWPREHRYIVCNSAPQVIRRGGSRVKPLPGSDKGQPLRGRALLGPGLFLEKECCMAREPFHHLGEFKSSLCM